MLCRVYDPMLGTILSANCDDFFKLEIIILITTSYTVSMQRHVLPCYREGGPDVQRIVNLPFKIEDHERS
jgi:hypothetical protein